VNRRAEWTKGALKEAARLDATTRERILAALKRLDDLTILVHRVRPRGDDYKE